MSQRRGKQRSNPLKEVRAIRMIILSANEERQYEVTKELAEHGGSVNRAAIKLGLSRRTIYRFVVGYRAEGKEYFVHGNRGRMPANSLPAETKARVRNLYERKYQGTNFAHYAELLRRNEGIDISESSLRAILSDAAILSPKAWRRTRKALAARLRAAMKAEKSAKKAETIRSRIVTIEEAHPRRPRCSMFGEMVQMDASQHTWFAGKKASLHLAVDDSTGTVVGGRFEEQETLAGYYHVLKQILETHGIPYMFYTDRRTVFDYRKKGADDTASDTFTQFGYACKQLGIEIRTTSVPQAKGRIERLNGTMQSRLVSELRLEGVTTMEQANKYLPGFIARYNARFAHKCNSIASVFEEPPTSERIDQALAVITERTVDSGHSIRFGKTHWRTINESGRQACLRKGTKGLVIRTFSGMTYFSVDDTVYPMDEIQERETNSKYFGLAAVEPRPRKQYVPPANHPWRQAAFVAHVRKQGHRAAADA